VQTKFALLKLSIESLVDHGYTYIGMDHFAKPEDELSRALEEKTLYRNFQGYSTHAGLDLIGLGMSSISVTERLYAQNQKSLESYYADLDQGRLATFRGVVLTDEDVLRREVITRLMCHFELSFSAIESTFHLDFSRHFAAELAALKPLCEDGLLTLTEEGLDVTPKGRLLIRNIAMVFDAYLANRGEGGPQFSRTV
jgi:oxygen-independent coproporphyrinogen-3 oxidase